MKAAFIGLGHMGGPMCANLPADGHGGKDFSSVILQYLKPGA